MFEADLLYHYTSQAGLLGIIANDSIWATDIRALNDWTEFRRLFEEAGVKPLVDSFKAGLSTLPEDPAEDKGARQTFLECVLAERNFETLLNIIKAQHDKPKETFVCSFAADGTGDRLSQWRGYSHSSQGFSLGFDKTLFKKQLALHDTLDKPVELVDCIYDNAATLEHIKKLGSDASANYGNPSRRKKDVPDWFTTPGKSAGYRETAFHLLDCLTETTVPFFKLAARCKHLGFQEELECRAVCFAYRKTLLPNTVKYRNGQFGPTAYIEIPLGLRNPSTCPLRRIVIGPRSHSGQDIDDIVNSVEMLLQKYGFQVRSPATPDGVEIVTSQIPYRSA